MPRVIGGRYGLSSKEFTPAMVMRVLDELERRDQTTGLVTMCIGGGMGITTILERI